MYGKPVPSVPPRLAITNLYQWLISLKKKCYIAVHNLSFDGPRLIDLITFYSLSEEFADVIVGFIDTLQIIKKETNRKGKGECSITGLANWLKISSANAHNAVQDVCILEKIINKSGISYETLTKYAVSYAEKSQKWIIDKRTNSLLPDLSPLNSIVSLDIRKKLARASINMQCLKDTYFQSSSEGIYQLLSKKENNKPVITASKSVINKIIDYFKKL